MCQHHTRGTSHLPPLLYDGMRKEKSKYQRQRQISECEFHTEYLGGARALLVDFTLHFIKIGHLLLPLFGRSLLVLHLVLLLVVVCCVERLFEGYLLSPPLLRITVVGFLLCRLQVLPVILGVLARSL